MGKAIRGFYSPSNRIIFLFFFFGRCCFEFVLCAQFITLPLFLLHAININFLIGMSRICFRGRGELLYCIHLCYIAGEALSII